jgi:hypothetical protein
VRVLDDWYSVKNGDVWNRVGFIRTHHGSLHKALKNLYPNHNWDPLRFTSVPKGFWNDEDTQRDALERYGRDKFGVKELDDWYNVSAEDVYSHLSFISNYYNSSLFSALNKLYPQHNWDPTRFSRVPLGYWQQPNTIQHYHNLFMKWKNVYNIRSVSDWFELAPHQLKLWKKVSKRIFGSQTKLLEEWFPEMVWHSQFTSQIQLTVTLIPV